MRRFFVFRPQLFTLLLIYFWGAALGNPIQIVAAENFYGQIAAQIGGKQVKVTSILKNPQQDPHLFSSTPKNAEAIADADIIIYNGINYDPWINNLIEAKGKNNKILINVANLVHKQEGDNPHIWYDPKTIEVLATTLNDQLQKLDPSHREAFAQRLAVFEANYQKLIQQMAEFRQEFANTPIIATEPVFNDMASALGLRMFGQSFQLSVMNDTEPNVTDTKDFDDMINQRQVNALIYNNQVTDPITERMKNLAIKAGIPVVGVTETEPSNQDYFSWMSGEINTLALALRTNSNNQRKN